MYSRVGLVDQSRSYVWDSTTLTWIASPSPAGSGVSSTQVAVSSVAGTVGVSPASSGATGFFATRLSDGSTFVTDSTQRAIRITSVDVGGSTQVTVSTGNVTVLPGSSGATGFFAVRISDGSTYVTPSTIVAVSSLAGTVAVAPATSNATGFYAVRVSDGSTYITDSTLRAIRITSVDAGGSTQVSISQVSTAAPASNDTGVVVRQVGYSTTVNVSSLAGPVIARSSAADMIATVKNSTIGELLASVQQNSTVWQVQLGVYSTIAAVSSLAGLVVVGPNSSAAPNAGDSGLIVRQVGYSTTINVSSLAGPVITRSSAADQLVTVYQSSYSGLLARVQNSTIGDLLASVQQNSTVWQVQAHNSSIADLLASAQQNSTVWQTQAKIQDSSAVGFVGTVTRPTTGMQGLAVRGILNDLQSTAFSTQGNGSTSNTVVSSVAGQRIKVYAYSITSTAQAINTLSFCSSLANVIWTMQMQSFSSGIAGANLAVTPPAWLFATAAAEPLVFKETGTTGSYHLAFSYFTEA